MKKNITSIFILGTIGIIFVVDTFLLMFGIPTISQVITDFITLDWKHLIVFLLLVQLICVHWIWGYYKNVV